MTAFAPLVFWPFRSAPVSCARLPDWGTFPQMSVIDEGFQKELLREQSWRFYGSKLKVLGDEMYRHLAILILCPWNCWGLWSHRNQRTIGICSHSTSRDLKCLCRFMQMTESEWWQSTRYGEWYRDLNNVRISPNCHWLITILLSVVYVHDGI